jgi:hypothetical protein
VELAEQFIEVLMDIKARVKIRQPKELKVLLIAVYY